MLVRNKKRKREIELDLADEGETAKGMNLGLIMYVMM